MGESACAAIDACLQTTCAPEHPDSIAEQPSCALLNCRADRGSETTKGGYQTASG